MKLIYTLISLSVGLSTIAQTQNDSLQGDREFYREDQFYAGVSFNLLTNLDDAINQSGFSGGFDLGFIRDFPVNKTSTLAIGLGLGININTYNQNIFLGETTSGDDIIAPIVDNNAFDTNRFSTHIVEVPIQFRWRNSTPDTYAFWRVYFGVKLGYIYYFKSTYKDDTNEVIQTDIESLNRFRTSAFLSFGYNLVNIQIQYDLNPLFDGQFTSKANSIGVNPLRLGFVFYIL